MHTEFLPIIYFFYGLAFFTMGILVTYQSYTSFLVPHSKGIIYIGIFGVLHGFGDWIPMFYSLCNLDPTIMLGLRYLSGFLIVISFPFLFNYGVQTFISQRRIQLIRFLPWLIVLIWVISSWLAMFKENNFYEWLNYSNVFSRYFLGFPSIMFTVIALWMVSNRVKQHGLQKTHIYFKVAGFFFTGYGVLAGLVVSPAGFFPANLINEITFQGFFGVPVQLARAICAIGVALVMVKSLEVFRTETERQLRQNKEIQLILKERERFARDIHDGVIQSLFGVGLMLQASAIEAEDKDPKLKEKIMFSLNQVNQSVKDLRNYIKALKTPEFAETSLEDLLKKLLTNMTAGIKLKPKLNITGNSPIPEHLKNHIYYIVKESLSNAIRHARASSVEVVVNLRETDVVVKIIDNGKGFNVEDKLSSFGTNFGLRTLSERVEEVNGALSIVSVPGQGTEILVTIPLGGD